MLAACALVSPGVALAQRTAASAAAAEKLFQEGRALMAAGQYKGACPKLAESQRLDPAVGTSLNLAECYEAIDKIASAWVTYREAETMARRAGQEARFTHAASRAEALERNLSYMTIAVASYPKYPEGLTITRDGETIGEAAWGSAVPVDGGKHIVEASAPGRRTWRREVQIAPRGARVNVEIPELDRAPADARAVQRTVGFIVGGVGIASLAAGGVFGWLTIRANNAGLDKCSADANKTGNPGDFDPRTGICFTGSKAWKDANDKKDEARTFANVANVLLPVGVVGLGVGAILVWRSSGTPTTQQQPAARVVPSLGGASFEGTF